MVSCCYFPDSFCLKSEQVKCYMPVLPKENENDPQRILFNVVIASFCLYYSPYGIPFLELLIITSPFVAVHSGYLRRWKSIFEDS